MEQKMTYAQALEHGKRRLENVQIAEAGLDAWYIMAHVTELDRAHFFLVQEDIIKQDVLEKFLALISKRAEHVPLQYILGNQEFMGLSFIVRPGVLIPRQDTELLVMEALKVSEGADVLDMCTGSGCIAVSIAALGKPAHVMAVDISADALAVARENAKRNKVEVSFLQSDMFLELDGVYDIIVSNPPYIESGEIPKLMPEVGSFEPIGALDGGADGLFFYRSIAQNAKQYLKDGGYLMVEIGCEQAAAVSELFRKEDFYDIKVIKDYSGLDRVVACRKR